jgi:Lipopolysaccharide kinase (Kdo/WaaP) family
VRRAQPIHVSLPYRSRLRQISDNPLWVFDSPQLVVWRKLPDRENCTFDTAWPDGRPLRFHVKRYPRRWARLAEDEATALEQMARKGIGCASLAAWGRLEDGRGFVITEDLAGFTPADKLIERGQPFERLLTPTADLAAKLHAAGLHHRDLYLCHFMARCESQVEIKLIDAARVRRLPRWPLRRRWIVKDLAQFWYSTTKLAVTDDQRDRWLARYIEENRPAAGAAKRGLIVAKGRRIAAHDAHLNDREPSRHVSIPGS